MWFGVFLVIVVEAGMITPPLGMNIFVIQAQASDIPLIRIYQAVMPYVAGPILLCLLLVIFPAIALFLPEVLFAP
ncbi:TRAP transporter large permease subunit [Cognatishimia sp. D5M38]|uniref:TRAP transporter large permease subunit n=1 Tax=Cognatishimia coralii TaxID=3083254 RepID=A0ABU8QLP8_9RHOB|nr:MULTISPECIES: TRAP transporter large permease subunit [Rhodobacterales]